MRVHITDNRVSGISVRDHIRSQLIQAIKLQLSNILRVTIEVEAFDLALGLADFFERRARALKAAKKSEDDTLEVEDGFVREIENVLYRQDTFTLNDDMLYSAVAPNVLVSDVPVTLPCVIQVTENIVGPVETKLKYLKFFSEVMHLFTQDVYPMGVPS